MFVETLPREDVLGTQQRLCGFLEELAEANATDLDRFRALRYLDRRMHAWSAAMIAEYAEIGRHAPARADQLWHAGYELSRSFAHAFRKLQQRSLPERASDGAALRAHLPDIMVRLLRHREVQVFLTLCRHAVWPREGWKSLHESYAHALQSGIERQRVTVYRPAGKPAVAVTPEQAYARILLLQLACDGRFAPPDLWYVRRVIAGASASLALRNASAGGNGFVVDPAGAAPPARASSVGGGAALFVDLAPLIAAIDNEIGRMKGDAEREDAAPRVARQRQILGQLRAACAPEAAPIRRRGERERVALKSLHAAFGGIGAIHRMLCDEARGAVADDADRTLPYLDVPPLDWQMRDSSESGCRLRGRVPHAQRLMPGSLCVYRDDEMRGCWSIGIVRRVQKLVRNNVDLGIEYLGRDVRAVALQAARSADFAEDSAPFVALYLPESPAQPRLPIKTLLLPGCEFAAGRELAMLSASARTEVRLKVALDQRLDTVWTSFDLTVPG